MEKYVCLDCGEIFSNPAKAKLDDGMKYGEYYLCCPECKSFDIEEIEEIEDDEEE